MKNKRTFLHFLHFKLSASLSFVTYRRSQLRTGTLWWWALWSAVSRRGRAAGSTWGHRAALQKYKWGLLQIMMVRGVVRMKGWKGWQGWQGCEGWEVCRKGGWVDKGHQLMSLICEYMQREHEWSEKRGISIEVTYRWFCCWCSQGRSTLRGGRCRAPPAPLYCGARVGWGRGGNMG